MKLRKPQTRGQKTLAERLDSARITGINEGFNAFAVCALIAAYNINCELEYMTEDQLGKFFSEWEAEVSRILGDELKGNPDNVDLLYGTMQKIRDKFNLSDMEDQ